MFQLHENLTSLLSGKWGLPESGIVLEVTVDTVCLSILFFTAWLVYLVCHRLVANYITGLFKKTKNTWDDEFINSGIIRRLTRLIPTVVLWMALPFAVHHQGYLTALSSICSIALIIITLTVLFSALNTCLGLYDRKEVSKEVPLQSLAQTVKILLSIIAGVLVLSVLLGKSPALIFSGFGALTAIIMLVFKDPILGLAAGVQLSSNKLIAVGDWIEVPKYGANGNVLELALTTVKVQNWDKTITTIPTYSLISESFKNWRGMSESGMRRIKRSLSLDMNSIRFLSSEEIGKLSEMELLKPYFAQKEKEIAEHQQGSEYPQDQRRLTNVGAYRAYLAAYANTHSAIADEATQLVRQLQPTDKGLPIEVYFFSNDNRWVEYENLQSDLFDHFISVLPEFDLRIYQSPTGRDFQALSGGC